jgi:hypothetical protein
MNLNSQQVKPKTTTGRSGELGRYLKAEEPAYKAGRRAGMSVSEEPEATSIEEEVSRPPRHARHEVRGNMTPPSFVIFQTVAICRDRVGLMTGNRFDDERIIIPSDQEVQSLSGRSWLRRFLEFVLFFLLGPAVGSALAGLLMLASEASASGPPNATLFEPLALVLGVASALVTWIAVGVAYMRHHVAVARALAEVFVVVVLPIWGLLINLSLPDCDACGGTNRPLVVPDVYTLYALYGASALAYLVSRRRSERLRPLGEAVLCAFLMAGVALCIVLAVHFSGPPLMGLVFAPIGLPLVAPWVVGALFAVDLVRRLRKRGLEVKPPDREITAGLTVGLTVVIFGLWSVIHRLLFDHGPLHTFTGACGHDWILATRMPPSQDCHYLCTVAARGHPWLVRPERLGQRRGRPILVNRQLALANAFEDLLRERWPRFARLCRRLYDRLGWPLSRHIAHPLASDAIYLLMKPAEWLFALTLLLVDHGDPEARIGRMYRPDREGWGNPQISVRVR